MSVPKPRRPAAPRPKSKTQHRPRRKSAVVLPPSVPANDTVAQLQSKRAKNGRRGEAIVEAFNAVAHASGVARLTKVPTPSAGWGKKMRAIGASTIDYVGFTLDRPVAVAIGLEVKSTTKPTLPLSVLRDHQRAYLDELHQAGGLAFLVVVYGTNRDVVLVPWGECRERRSLDRDFLADRIVEADGFVRALAGGRRGAVPSCFDCGVAPCLGRPLCERAAPDGPGDSQAAFAAFLGRKVVFR